MTPDGKRPEKEVVIAEAQNALRRKQRQALKDIFGIKEGGDESQH